MSGGEILNLVQGSGTHDRPDFSQKTGLMGDVEREVNYLFDYIRTTYVNDHDVKRRRPLRLAPFVYDLDRCAKAIVMQVLEAMNLFLLKDAPIPCYLAIDSRLVVASIEDRFGDSFSKAGLDGYQYLEKMVQLPFCLPDLAKDRKKNFLRKTLQGNMLDPLSIYERLKFLEGENVRGLQTFLKLDLKNRAP